LNWIFYNPWYKDALIITKLGILLAVLIGLRFIGKQNKCPPKFLIGKGWEQRQLKPLSHLDNFTSACVVFIFKAVI